MSWVISSLANDLQFTSRGGGLWFTFISDHNLHDELQDDLMLATEPSIIKKVQRLL